MSPQLEKFAMLDLGKVLGMGLMLSAFYYFFLFDDGSDLELAIQEVEARIASEETRKVETDKAKSEEERSQERIEDLRKSIKTVATQMPASLKSLDVNRYIDEAAARANLKVSAKRPGATVKLSSASVEEIPVQVEMRGNYSQFAKFLVDLGAQDQVLRLKSFRMLPVDEKKGSSALKIEAIIAGYRSVEQEADGLGGGK